MLISGVPGKHINYLFAYHPEPPSLNSDMFSSFFPLFFLFFFWCGGFGGVRRVLGDLFLLLVLMGFCL